MRLFTLSVYILGYLYLSYRYPFQINSSTTSPTYADTPVFLSLGKYLAFVFLLCSFAILNLRRLQKIIVDKPIRYTLVFVLYGLSLSVVEVFFFNELYLLEALIFSSIMIIPAVYMQHHPVEFSELNLKLLTFFAKALLAVLFLQLFLFFYFGRLPALAYENSISVRFGSIIDDPNGFSILISLFVFIFYSSKRGFNVFWIGCVVVSLLATQSLTGLLSVILSALTIITFRTFVYKEKSAIKTLFFIFLGASLILVPIFLFGKQYIMEFWRLKQLSIEDHGKSLSVLDMYDTPEFFFMSGLGQSGEVGYLNILLNSGVVYFALYFAFHLYMVFKSFLILFWLRGGGKGSDVCKFYTCSASFILCTTIGGFNLPLSNVFPINYFYFFFSGIVLFTSKRCLLNDDF